MRAKRDQRLREFGLSPEHIQALDAQGQLPRYAKGGAVTPAGYLDPDTVAGLSDLGFAIPDVSAPTVPMAPGAPGGAPPITTLQPQAPILPGQGLPVGFTGPAPTEGAPAAPLTDADLAAAGMGQRSYGPENLMSTGGASGSWTPPPADPNAPAAPGSVVLHQPDAPQAQPAMAPGMAPGGGGADIPDAPQLTASNYTGLADAQRDLGDVEAAGARRQAEAYEAAQEKMRQEDAAWKATESSYQGMLNQAREHASRSPTKDWSTGHTILAALAMAFGSFGSGLTKTPNYAMQIIDKAIDEEVRGRQTALASLERQYGSAKDAHMAMRSAILDHLKLDVEARGARAQSDTVRQKAQMMALALDNKQVEAQNSIKQNQFTANMQRAGLQIEQEKISATRSARVMEMQQKYGERYVPGIGVMRTDDDAKQAKQYVIGRADMEGAVSAIEALRRKHPGGMIPMGPDQALAERAGRQLQMAAKQGLNLGTLSDSDVKLLESLSVGSPLSLFTRYDTVRAQLGAIRQDWAQKAMAYRSLAMIPMADDAMGQSGGAGAGLRTFKPVGGR